MIEVRGVRKWIQNGARRVEILKGIDISIPSGQFVAIVGASGSGKSTLLGLLAGLDTPSEGEIWLDGTPIHNLEEEALAEGAGVDLEIFSAAVAVVKNVVGAQRVDPLEREVGLGFEIVVIILRDRQEVDAVRLEPRNCRGEIGGGEGDVLDARAERLGEKA